jgi:putative inorganic carbon (HCO3(-)) transporter
MQADLPITLPHVLDYGVTPAEEPRYGFGFVVFLLVNAVLFIRPGELWAALEEIPIYYVLIVICIIASFPVLVKQLSWTDLKANPTTLAVLGFFGAILLSYLTKFNFWMVRATAEELYKVVLYYLLLVGLVSSPKRLSVFLGWVAGCVVVIAGLSVLQYHGIIELAGIKFVDRLNGTNPLTGEASFVTQLYRPGIFDDPNDLSLILTATMLILLHLVIQRKGAGRLLWLLPLPVVGYAFALTNSRGGFLALMGGGLTLIVARFGWKKSVPLTVVTVPLMLFLFAGRQTNINVEGEDTAAGRMLLWREGFMVMRPMPIFGIGYLQMQERDVVGHVAHNSYVQSFVETGLVGGTFFASVVSLPIIMLRRKREATAAEVDERLLGWRPCLLALVAAYAVGMCSLTRCYTITTYVMIGLGGAYWRMVASDRPQVPPVLDKKLVKRQIGIGAGTLVMFYLMQRFMV